MSEFIQIGDSVIVSDEGKAGNYFGLGRVTEVCRFGEAVYYRVAPVCPLNPKWDIEWKFVSSRVVLAPPPPTLMSPAIGLKQTNPKDAIGSDKMPLHLWPETATVMGTLGMLDGALKYGRLNWRSAGIRTSIYIDAVRRHINAYAEGEDFDPDSGCPHLAHALACLAIVVDAGAAGNLNDDRAYPGGYRSLVDELTPHVARLKEKHADKSPKHWTINDTKEVSQ